MAKYEPIKCAPNDFYEDGPHLPNLSVREKESTFSGLFDPQGNPLFRFPNPIGFGRDNEWQ